MSERITEAELQRIEELDPDEILSNVQILADEVRRLRGLIVGAADTSWDECPIDGPAEDGAYLQCAKTDCAWPAFRAEARAIREEQKHG